VDRPRTCRHQALSISIAALAETSANSIEASSARPAIFDFADIAGSAEAADATFDFADVAECRVVRKSRRIRSRLRRRGRDLISPRSPALPRPPTAARDL
jgi:hypothetical protein